MQICLKSNSCLLQDCSVPVWIQYLKTLLDGFLINLKSLLRLPCFDFFLFLNIFFQLWCTLSPSFRKCYTSNVWLKHTLEKLPLSFNISHAISHKFKQKEHQTICSLFHFPPQQEVVPSYLATSPIMSDGALLMSSSLMGKKSSAGPSIQTLGSAASAGENGSGMMKKRRKRRRKARADSVRREESGDYSEDDDMFTIDISSDEGTERESSR